MARRTVGLYERLDKRADWTNRDFEHLAYVTARIVEVVGVMSRQNVIDEMVRACRENKAVNGLEFKEELFRRRVQEWLEKGAH